VEQPTDDLTRKLRDDHLLPLLKLDLPKVLLAKPVLREQAQPMPGVARHLLTSLFLLQHDLAARAHRLHRPHALLDKPRPRVAAHDAELPYLLGRVAADGNAAVSQIEAEQVRVVGTWFWQGGVLGTPRARGA
jgi:hypothetical protein